MEASQFKPGIPVEVGIGQVSVQRLLCPNASVMTGPGTNTYLLGSNIMALVDPGPALTEHTDAIMKVLNGRALSHIFTTHSHADHSPGTAVLKSLTGAEVVGFAPPAQALFQDTSFRPDRLYSNGEILTCDEFSIQLIHTPGHVSNHVCFLLVEDALLFTGDHILQGTTPVILPPDGDMADYLTSLAQLQTLPLQGLAPGHGAIMGEPEQMINALIRHRQRRELKIINAMTSLGQSTLDQLVVVAYDDVPQHLWPWAQKTMLAHLIKLKHEGRAIISPASQSPYNAESKWVLND